MLCDHSPRVSPCRYSLETGVDVNTGAVGAVVEVVERGPVRAVISVAFTIPRPGGEHLAPPSLVRQWIVVTAGSALVEFETEVDWHESHKVCARVL